MLLFYDEGTSFRGIIFFFSIWVFSHEHSRITGLQGKGEGISLTPHYHFHPLHRHLDISRAITAESSPLHIASSQTRTGSLRFPSASREPLSYALSLLKSSTNVTLSTQGSIFHYTDTSGHKFGINPTVFNAPILCPLNKVF